MLDRRGFSGYVAEVENLIKGDLIPVNIRGGYSNDVLSVDSVDCGMDVTVVHGFLLWEGKHSQISVPALSVKVEVWNS